MVCRGCPTGWGSPDPTDSHQRRLGTRRSDLGHSSSIIDYDTFVITTFSSTTNAPKNPSTLGRSEHFRPRDLLRRGRDRGFVFPLNSGIFNSLIPVAVIKGANLGILRPLTTHRPWVAIRVEDLDRTTTIPFPYQKGTLNASPRSVSRIPRYSGFV